MENDPLSFRTHILPSGLRVCHNHRPLPFFACKLVVHAGNRSDPPGKEELMHLVEHLLSSGTHGWPRRSLLEMEHWLRAERLDCSLGETHLDCSAYDGKATNGRLQKLLSVLHDLVLLPTLDSDLEKEREIVRCERDEQMTLEERAYDAFRRKAIFGSADLARLNGWAEDATLNALTLDDVREAHLAGYRTANMSLIVSGGVDEDALLNVAESIFYPDGRDMSPPVRLGPIALRAPCPHEGRKKRSSGRIGKVALNYEWHLPHGSRHPLTFAGTAIQEMLFDRIREELQATYDVQVENTVKMDHRIVRIATKVSPDKELLVRSIIKATLGDIPSTIAALPRLKEEYRMAVELNEPSVAEAVAHVAYQLDAYGMIRTTEETLKGAEAVTEEDVADLLTHQLQIDNAFVTASEED